MLSNKLRYEYISKFLIFERANSFFIHNFRIEAEGYKVPDNVPAEPTPIKAAPVIETISLKELAKKTNTDDLKVTITLNITSIL